MKRSLANQKIRMTMETSDGITLDITGMVQSFSVGFNPTGLQTFTIEGYSEAPALWSTREEKIQDTRRMRTSSEWKCDHCASINERKDKKCQSCGASRSFLYDL